MPIAIGSKWQWIKSLDQRYTAIVELIDGNRVTLAEDFGRVVFDTTVDVLLRDYVPVLRTLYGR
jgi:hypothetical protein